MKYFFKRTYVGPNNTSYYRNTEVPADFPKDTLERLLKDGLIGSIETPNDFIEKVAKITRKKGTVVVEDSIESLDPDQKNRSE